MFKFIVLTCAIIGAVSCYDFTDTDFNKILLDDLLEYDAFADDDLPTIVNLQRSRRDDHPPPPPPPSSPDHPHPHPPQPPHCKPHGGGGRHHRCCNDDFEYTNDMKELKKQCFADIKKARKAKHLDAEFDVFSCEKVERAKEKVICAMECVARKEGLIDETGYPEEKKIKDHLRAKYKEGAWQLKVIDDIVDTCMSDVAIKMTLETKKKSNNTNAINSKELNTAPMEPKCNSAPSIFTHCMWRQLTMKCPVELQDQSHHCQRMREKFTKKEHKPAKDTSGNNNNDNKEKENVEKPEVPKAVTK